jgi:starch synthase
MTGLIPAYMKTAYKKEPVFSHSKVVYTIGQNTFKEKLGADFVKMAMINKQYQRKRPRSLAKEATNTAMFRVGSFLCGCYYFRSGESG